MDATVKIPKNAAKTMPTPQNRGGKVLLTLASIFNKLYWTRVIYKTETNHALEEMASAARAAFERAAIT